MADRRAERRCKTDLIKVKAAVDSVSGLTTIPEDGRKPDVSHLGRKLDKLRTSWESFEGSHGTLFGLVTDEGKVAKVKLMYEQQLAICTEALDKGESLHAELLGVGPAPFNLKERIEDCLLRRGHLTAAAERTLDGVFVILETDAVPGRTVLQAQLKMLDDVTKKMFQASTITAEAVELDYVNADAH